MTADVNVTEKVARALPDLIASVVPGLLQERVRDAALSALADPEVQAGIAGVLRRHSWYEITAEGVVCHCNHQGPPYSGGITAQHWLAEHQTAAVVEWLRGQA